jgi:hypothetical protein
MTTTYVPTGRFPEGIQKKDLSFTLEFKRKIVFLSDEFDTCVFLKNEEGEEFKAALTEQEIELVLIVDHDNCDGKAKTVEEFIETIVDEEMKHVKNKTGDKVGLYHYNNGEWELAAEEDEDDE